MNATAPFAAPSIRETLFGDQPFTALDQHATEEPGRSFARAKIKVESGNEPEAVHLLQNILQTPGLASRHYLQAHHCMRQLGYAVNLEKELLGVVVEVALPEGLDLLAAYGDYTARYYNYSGAGIVWEHPNACLDDAVTEVLQAGKAIMDRIGPWGGKRPAAPPTNHVRINLLTSQGLHFGEGPMHLLMNDPMGGTMLRAAIALMDRLIQLTEKNQ